MKVFISSVRHGLEAERDALPGLVAALGHQPKRFEDYTAQDVPSRQACLDGVRDADVYVLVLGDVYGNPLPDTGHAPTEEEYVAARARGIPILVFLKRGGTPDDQQQAFIDRVSGYVDGRFRKSFSDTAGLLTAVAGALRELGSRPPVLAWSALTVPTDVPWRDKDSNTFGFNRTELETYVMPVGPTNRLLATVLTALPERLGRAGRDGGLFAQAGALNLYTAGDDTVARAASEARTTGAGIRVRTDRSIAIWEQLPTDMLGAIIDEADMAARITKAVRLASALALIETEQVAFGLGLRLGGMATIGDASELGHRSSAQPIGFGGDQKWARVGAQDTVPTATLGPAGAEIAGELAKRLMIAVRAVA